MVINEGQPVGLRSAQIIWTKADTALPSRPTVNLPVYLNGDRSDVMFSVDLETDGVKQDVVSQRGVCLTAV